MEYHITALPGDGIGPEIMEAGLACLGTIAQKFGHIFHVEKLPFGGDGIDKENDPLPPKTLKACQNSDAILLAAIGGSKWDNAPKRPEEALLELRKTLGLYANIRPVKVFSQIAHLSPLKEEIVRGTDLVVVRELTGGLYFGTPKHWDNKSGVDTLCYSREEIYRIIHKAFTLAQNRRKKVASIDKANVLSTSKLWRKIANEISQEFPDVELTHYYVDAAAMLLMQNPSRFDVIVTENLFGDILSDEASILSGSLGMLPSASFSLDGPSLFEPIHGSAPELAGKNIANPISMILSVAMLLREAFQLEKEACALEKAVNDTLSSGILTQDLGGNAKTTELSKAIQERMIGGTQHG
ncbi:3-isopropylmalate dehydrogenase [Clostridia bacterium]|nr:3-isopropylmalate dehydrogenase [Clostridia bacterium]